MMGYLLLLLLAFVAQPLVAPVLVIMMLVGVPVPASQATEPVYLTSEPVYLASVACAMLPSPCASLQAKVQDHIQDDPVLVPADQVAIHVLPKE